MFKKLFAFLVLVAFVLFAASYVTGYITLSGDGLGFDSGGSGGMVVDLSITTDTEVYHSGEMMEATVSVACNQDLESTIIKLYGVMDRFGSYRINEEQIIGIKAPGEGIVFLASMPRCYGCAGVEEGEYELRADLIHKGELYSATKTITLEK